MKPMLNYVRCYFQSCKGKKYSILKCYECLQKQGDDINSNLILVLLNMVTCVRSLLIIDLFRCRYAIVLPQVLGYLIQVIFEKNINRDG